jgi:hypothetical protein
MGNPNTAAMNRQLAAYENTPAKGLLRSMINLTWAYI